MSPVSFMLNFVLMVLCSFLPLVNEEDIPKEKRYYDDKKGKKRSIKMKGTTMKKHFVLIALVGVLTLSGCNEKKSGDNKIDTETMASAQAVGTQALTVDQVLARADSLVGQEIMVEAVCTHICKHGGKKVFLMGSDDTKSLRVEAGETIGSFKQEVMNSLVTIIGTLEEDRIDEAYLTQWENELVTADAEAHEEGSCTAEQMANNEKAAKSAKERIANMRTQIAERQEKEGKAYLSFYYLQSNSYTIAQ